MGIWAAQEEKPNDSGTGVTSTKWLSEVPHNEPDMNEIQLHSRVSVLYNWQSKTIRHVSKALALKNRKLNGKTKTNKKKTKQNPSKQKTT